MMLWPFALTGAMMLADRIVHRLRRAMLPSELVPGRLLFLSSIAILTHPILDTLNTYGMRWLMPFSGRWFYGDTLFIVDPWLWLVLGAGVMLSRSRHGRARAALAISLGYIAAMALSTLAARHAALAEIAAITGQPVQRLMVSPFPVNPFRRRVVVEQAEVYRTAEFRWLAARHVDPGSIRLFPKGPADDPAVRAAARTTLGRRFLGWARYPAFQLEPAGAGSFVVHIIDLRYADRPGARFGSVSIPVTLEPGSARAEAQSDLTE
jgi:inner membrane protein